MAAASERVLNRRMNVRYGDPWQARDPIFRTVTGTGASDRQVRSRRQVESQMSWYLSQLAIWLLVLVPTFLATRWLLRRVQRMRCGVPLMLIVLALAATLALLVTPVALPLGAVVLPYSALTVMAVVSGAEWSEPHFGLTWQYAPPPGFAMAFTFLLASALIWLVLQRNRR